MPYNFLLWILKKKTVSSILNKITNVSYLIEILISYKKRREIATVILDGTFFELNSLNEFKENIGNVLKKYKHIIIIVPQGTRTSLDKSLKYGGIPSKKHARNAFKELKNMEYGAQLKNGLLGLNLQKTEDNITFMFPNERYNYALAGKYGYKLEGNANKSQIELFVLALKYSSFYKTFIVSTDPTLHTFCQQSWQVDHINPSGLDYRRISNETFEKSI